MIKHTPHDHPDHGSLQLALGEIKTLADRMNRGEKEVDQAEREAERLRDLEATIEGMTEVCVIFVLHTNGNYNLFTSCESAHTRPWAKWILIWPLLNLQLLDSSLIMHTFAHSHILSFVMICMATQSSFSILVKTLVWMYTKLHWLFFSTCKQLAFKTEKV